MGRTAKPPYWLPNRSALLGGNAQDEHLELGIVEVQGQLVFAVVDFDEELDTRGSRVESEPRAGLRGILGGMTTSRTGGSPNAPKTLIVALALFPRQRLALLLNLYAVFLRIQWKPGAAFRE